MANSPLAALLEKLLSRSDTAQVPVQIALTGDLTITGALKRGEVDGIVQLRSFSQDKRTGKMDPVDLYIELKDIKMIAVPVDQTIVVPESTIIPPNSSH